MRISALKVIKPNARLLSLVFSNHLRLDYLIPYSFYWVVLPSNSGCALHFKISLVAPWRCPYWTCPDCGTEKSNGLSLDIHKEADHKHGLHINSVNNSKLCIPIVNSKLMYAPLGTHHYLVPGCFPVCSLIVLEGTYG